MTYVLMAVFVLSHAGMFFLGALAYHGIRMLAMRPVYRIPSQLTEKNLKAAADRLARAEIQRERFEHIDKNFAGGRFEEIPDEPAAFAPSGKK